MNVDFSLIKILFQLSLFVLLLIKLRYLTRLYIIPALHNYQQEGNEKRFTLQEQHAILVTQKKQLATQFLQQEKQLALLTSKLEKWYKGWQELQKTKEKEFEEREKKIAHLIEEQHKNVLHKRACRNYTEAALDTAQEQLQRSGTTPQTAAFFENATEHASSLKNPTKDDDAETDA